MYSEVRKTPCNLHKEQIMRGLHCVTIQTVKQRFVFINKAEWSRICRKSWIFQKLKSNSAERALKGEQFLWLHISWSSSRTKVENVPIRMNGKMPPNSCNFWHVMVIDKTCKYWVTGDIAELCDVCFIFVECESMFIKWGHQSERQNRYRLLSSRNLGPKLTLQLMGELLECLSL